ncbi:MAG TPA: glycosyltransferase [Mesorhizobium sp.]|jgi:glycosyltransferase involved in cell wall biosynthesis|nr:glycosyltransferase [Mesorhizobium sp.]
MTSVEGMQVTRILFVFAELGIGGEEAELKLLARHLDASRYRLDAVGCFHREGTPFRTHDELEALGVSVDRTPYGLSFDETVAYLARKLPAYDIVVSCQNVADIYPALERLHLRPALIEHGRSVDEALAGPKHFTQRYVALGRKIREAAAGRMTDRARHAVEIAPMAEPNEVSPVRRARIRQALGLAPDQPVIGCVSVLAPERHLEDFVEAAALVGRGRPEARFVLVGGPDAASPHHGDRLRALAAEKGLADAMILLGDRPDCRDLIAAFDILVAIPGREGMRHAMVEAGAAGVAVVASSASGAKDWITDGAQGLIVPSAAPPVAADAVARLIDDSALRRRLGRAFHHRVLEHHAASVLARRWEALFESVSAERRVAPVQPSLFRSFFQGGFECSTHRRRTPDGFRRLDIIQAIGHDENIEQDYGHLRKHGVATVRDGLRWHLIERAPGRYDWSSFLPMLQAARRSGTQVIWDVMHYGWPDDIDIWRPEFVTRFARFAREAARIVRSETDGPAFYCPVNEISFLAWGGGEVGYMNPHAHGRGFELKVQLVRASVAAMNEILSVDPDARFVHCDPAVNILRNPDRPHEHEDADHYHELQFQSWEMLAGRIWPQLGGSPRHLDVLGVNYYHNNQWFHHGGAIDIGHPLYKPFSRILVELYARFGRPILIAETGIEAERRPSWLRYIGSEVRRAIEAGVPVQGICLYPIANHPGWDDDRDCPNGLFSAQVSAGRRQVHEPLAAELANQQQEFRRFWEEDAVPAEHRLARAG